MAELRMDTEPMFRPSKRRKFYRKRAGSDTGLDPDTPASTPRSGDPTASASPLPEADGAHTNPKHSSETPSMATILRLRNAARARRGGIEFTASDGGSSRGQRNSNTEAQMMQADQDGIPEDLVAVINRFAPQTGQVGIDANKHMMSYIDKELAKRRAGSPSHTSHHNEHDSAILDGSTSAAGGGSGPTPTEQLARRQPAGLGKLQEIDLGPSAALSNIARTEAATRRLDGADDGDDAADNNSGSASVRLGRDGKPRRGPKRRTSADLRRDRLVEEVLRETRLEVYSPPPSPPGTSTAAAAQEAADDRIAEQFRREFMDAVSSRHRRRPKAAPATGGGSGGGGKAGEAEKSRGPKLGGSRSARAAMRERELASKKAGR
ncbi:MAG: hypothetical protein M1825_001708 [Sarcosagium campestre]|nr:MAG: hypothetical protein M1825_001708 [Sarcosagium campestre]